MTRTERLATRRAQRRLYVLATSGLALLIALMFVVGSAVSAEPAESDTGLYNDVGRWPDNMTGLCLEDHTGGYPVSQAAAAFSEHVHIVVRTDCSRATYVVQVHTVIEPDAGWAGWFDTRKDDAGVWERGRIRLNLHHAQRMDAAKWETLIVHEIGHALGLDHAPDGIDSVMHHDTRMYDAGKLTEADHSQLREIYGG